MRRFAKTDKVGDLLKHAISNALLSEMEDGRLRWVNVVEVRVTRDLSVARVFYTCIEPALGRDEARDALSQALPALKKYLGHNLHLRQLPELRFLYDDTEERARRIEGILDDLGRGEP